MPYVAKYKQNLQLVVVEEPTLSLATPTFSLSESQIVVPTLDILFRDFHENFNGEIDIESSSSRITSTEEQLPPPMIKESLPISISTKERFQPQITLEKPEEILPNPISIVGQQPIIQDYTGSYIVHHQDTVNTVFTDRPTVDVRIKLHK